MSTLKENIAAYEAMQEDLELDYFGKWVVFHNEELIGSYATSEEAAEEAITRIKQGPCLVRRVGASHLTLPPYVHYRTLNAND
jgi:hypothetical protein